MARRPQRGTSLIELIIGLAILAVGVMITARFFTFAKKDEKSLTARQSAVSRADAFAKFIEKDLHFAVKGTTLNLSCRSGWCPTLSIDRVADQALRKFRVTYQTICQRIPSSYTKLIPSFSRSDLSKGDCFYQAKTCSRGYLPAITITTRSLSNNIESFPPYPPRTPDFSKMGASSGGVAENLIGAAVCGKKGAKAGIIQFNFLTLSGEQLPKVTVRNLNFTLGTLAKIQMVPQ